MAGTVITHRMASATGKAGHWSFSSCKRGGSQGVPAAQQGLEEVYPNRDAGWGFWELKSTELYVAKVEKHCYKQFHPKLICCQSDSLLGVVGLSFIQPLGTKGIVDPPDMEEQR